MEKIVREKHHRLPEEFYKGFKIVSFTACIKDRISFFMTQERFQVFETMLHESLKENKSDAEIYLFMPDHAHFLLRGPSDSADVLNAMKVFKLKSGYWLSQHNSSIHWQKDFYDHVIRKEDDVAKHIRYILYNPVRAGLVEDWKNYPFKGSTSHKLDEWE